MKTIEHTIREELFKLGISGDDIKVQHSKNNNQITFEVGQGINFEEMTKVSNLFKTTKINTNGETRNSGYCETCWSEYSVTVVYVSEIPEEVFKEYE